MFEPTAAQARFIEEASPESVLTACPGSGKTHTAVLRFIERCKTGNTGVAFLSYTNVAVDEAHEVAREFGANGTIGSPNLVSTIDAFFRNFVFDPFVRSALPEVPVDIEIFESRAPAAIANDLSFDLGGIRKVAAGKAMRDIGLPAWNAVGFLDASGALRFDFKKNAYSEDRVTILPLHNKSIFETKISYLKRGFATYNDILIYCYLLLSKKVRRIPEIVARRFGEIIVDEAQDTSMLQQAMLRTIATAGAKISYVGDKNQGIYLFNKANPNYLDALVGHEPHALDVNYRSIKSIIDVVNAHFAVTMKHVREKKHDLHGAYVFVGADVDAVSSFESLLSHVAISEKNAVVIVRSRSHMGKTLALQVTKGWRSIPRLAIESWQRERRGDLEGSLRATVRLIRDASTAESLEPLDEARLKDLGWRFLRCGRFPDPSNDESPQGWCERLKDALQAYVESSGLTTHEKFGNRAARSGLPPKGGALDYFSFVRPNIRTTVIHQVKGETISAVLVIAPDKQHEAWLSADPDQEESNICYVAFTRAADLLVLHCPTEQHAAEWRKRGFLNFPK